MTVKELREVRESYRELARDILASGDYRSQIVGICMSLADEGCYNHHERGQRLLAFFQALKDEGMC